MFLGFSSLASFHGGDGGVRSDDVRGGFFVSFAVVAPMLVLPPIPLA
jgi:hypothetical protein